ncbi:hypothetical protein B0O99DRAFT_696467 [Bisporella sp. PMI_857]|nr:hypothetical protein B0O99DRAFT_696467 [Bisporella sp. PMI_857]
MAHTFQVLLFGDETGDFRDPLQKLCERQKGVVFLHFLERVKDTLRDEVRQHPRQVQAQIPQFTDIHDLVKRYIDSGSRNTILETTLACICQLASVVSFFEEHQSEYIVPSDTVLVGLCTGLLASAAVSASQSLLDLISIALKVVRVAFRIGVKVDAAARRLSTDHDVEIAQSWSRVVLGGRKDATISEVTQFNETKGLPKASQAYISSTSREVVTISGPPETLRTLFQESGYLCAHKSVPLHIFGPFHASHLYTDVDVEEVLQPITEANIKLIYPLIRVISGATEELSLDAGMYKLLREVVKDILIRPLSFDRVLSAVASEIRKSGKTTCKVSSVGPSNALSSLISAVKAGPYIKVTAGEQLGTIGPEKSPQDEALKIAVVGMAGRFPSADNLEGLWRLLEQGLDVHRRIPPDRFDVEAHYDPTSKKKNTSHTPYGCFIEQPGLFDPRFFNMSPREAYQTDPMGRLALVTAYEALEMSGFVPNRTPSSMLNRIGTFYGQTSDDWRQVNAAQKIDTYYIPGTIRAFASGRINYHFKFSGPSYNVDTACSSSFAAIQLACTSLLAKECDTAIAGGLNVMTAPDLFAGLSRAQFLSKTGSCKTFDETADGFCRGDGVGTVVLKRLEDAENDNDPILGVILGMATNHSAEAVSITQPHPETQELLYRKILKKTGVDFRDVSYVEMHGTGTQAGDGAEMKSISNVFAPRQERRLPGQTVHVGALKANIGHGEASAGVASLIKVLLMFQRNAIPPHIGIKGTMNKRFPKDMNERGIRIAFKETPWLAPAGSKRRAYLNNFSAAGGNTGLLLEDAQSSTTNSNERDPRTAFVVAVTAKSVGSLEKNIHNLISYLEKYPDTSLAKLSYTSTARRTQHPFRISVAVSDISEVNGALISAQNKSVKNVSSNTPKVSFAFTGQGSHYPALGRELFESSKQFRSDILDFDRIGQNQGFPSFLPLVDGTITVMDSISPVVLQLGQSCIQMALARLWMSWGISPTAVVGHSLGEYAALNVAGVLSASDTIFLVGRRAQLLEKNCTAGTHAMLAVATSVSSVKDILVGGSLEVACINGPRETVISGPAEQMISYSKTLKSAGIKCVLLPTTYAFHSAQVSAILDSFNEQASCITFRSPAIPVISPLLREVVTDGHVFGAEYLARHARETVDFLGAISKAKTGGLIDQNMIWVEIGPTPVCSAFIKSSLGGEVVTIPSLRKKEDPWRTTTSSLSILHRKGVNIDWNEFHREYESAHEVLPLPTYAFENKNYWLEYTNNWCLNKGELLVPPSQARAPKSARDRSLSTSSVQKVTKEDFGNTVTLVAESDLSDPGLNSAVTGHLVNGSALCPSAVYADMALTLAGYLYRKANKQEDDVGMDVRHLEIVKPLIAKGINSKEPQLVRIIATAERPIKSTKIRFCSISRDGTETDLHATCVVEYGDTKSWVEEWSRVAYLYRSRIDVLAQGSSKGKYNKISRAQAYELFSALVQYDKKYHGMKEVIIDSKNFEATSVVEFQASEYDGDFELSPYWIDNIAHLSGFVLNGSDAVDSRKTVYISHGWESLRIARPLSASKSYHTYVKMHAGAKQTMAGDVYVFEGGEMVALVGGVKFQAIPRVVLNKLLPPINGAGSLSKAVRDKTTQKETSPALTKHVPKSRTAQISTRPAHNTTPPVVPLRPAPTPAHLESDTFVGIIAEELGMAASELPDTAVFADIGVDSLMSLTITGRMREELDMDVPTSLFTDHATIGEAKAALSALNGNGNGSIESVMPDTSGSSIPGSTVSDGPSSEFAMPAISSDKMTDKILSIISEELGIEESELIGMANFADMGVDSLMSLTITGRIREEVDLDVPTSFFTDYPTISEVKSAVVAMLGMINGASRSARLAISSENNSKPSVSFATNSYKSHMTGASSDIPDKILSIISEELGIEESELIGMANFADMGVDSLMSLTITGRAREELELDVPTSFFTDYPTISEAKTAILVLLGLGDPSTRSATPNSSTEDNTANESIGTSLTTPDPEGKARLELHLGTEGKDHPLATSILLQGSPKNASKTLFLFPDGSGSATSYAAFPSIAPDVCVYGLNCPFMKSPQDYTNGIDGVATQYLAEIRRRQEDGPYHLGGWSAGGVIAYEVAQQLLEMGEQVERLILIDSPCPIGLEPLPSSLLHFVNATGLLGTGKTPSWLIPHFEASVANLATYMPYPMDSHRAPKTFMIWARDGFTDSQERTYPRSASEPKSVKFLLDRRPDDFGPYGWDLLLGRENIIGINMVGGSHFTMIREPAARQLAPLLRQGLGIGG